MKHACALFAVLTVALAVLLGGPPAVNADEGRVPLPTLAKGKGEQCVAPVDVMRRDHMDLLKTQRDETMRQGIRGNEFSLKGCVDCHATPDPTVKEGHVRNLTAFCDQCHEYAGIRIDCFDCHTDEPMPAVSAGRSMERDDEIRLYGMLGSYLSEKGRSQ